MTNRKMLTTKFGEVPQELFDKIESIRDHPSMLEACKKLEDLKEEGQALHKNIQKYSTNVEDDAQKLLDGDSLEETKGISKQELIRKREALERAVTLQIGVIQSLEARLIREGLAALEPLGKKYVQATIDALAAAEKALTRQTELFAVLRVKGYKQPLRPAKWQTTPLEMQLLNGGRFPSLALHLQKLRELWGFKPVGKHIKG